MPRWIWLHSRRTRTQPGFVYFGDSKYFHSLRPYSSKYLPTTIDRVKQVHHFMTDKSLALKVLVVLLFFPNQLEEEKQRNSLNWNHLYFVEVILLLQSLCLAFWHWNKFIQKRGERREKRSQARRGVAAIVRKTRWSKLLLHWLTESQVFKPLAVL